uniref:EXPERA domain-containing protein n=1 Tax=Leersia perrieri TaxID=77586 RepID=A0A0D9VWV8_9ORYZ
MGFVAATADAVVALFSLIVAVAAPLFDSQIVLPGRLFAALLVDIFRWFVAEFGHYLVADPPPFFRGLVWLSLAFLWVCVANLYGILARRPWSAATSLMAGGFMLTYLSVIFGEMVGSGRLTLKLIQLYVPLALFAITAILRGFSTCSARGTAVSSHAPTALDLDLWNTIEVVQPYYDYEVAMLNPKAGGVTWAMVPLSIGSFLRRPTSPHQDWPLSVCSYVADAQPPLGDLRCLDHI